MAASNLKRRKADQEIAEPKPGISYIPKHDDPSDSSDSDSDPSSSITKLLEPLTKDQLISLLRTAALSHPPTLSAVRSTADADPSHRKIFVHGLAFETSADSLRLAFSPFGPIDDVRIVSDKNTGRSKGYGFILYRNRKSAKKALKDPQKLIDNRMTSCQLASLGPPNSTASGSGAAGASNPGTNSNPNHHNQGDNLQRKVYVGNVHPDVDAGRLRAFFSQFGEIEEGPLGFDRATGKPKGYALFVYKTMDGARKALEESTKNFEGHLLVCNKASENSNRGAGQRGAMTMGQQQQMPPQANLMNPNTNFNANMNNPNPNFNAQNVPGTVGPGGYGVPGAVPDMTTLLAQGGMLPNQALIAMLAAMQQNQGTFGLNPALLASLNPAFAAAALGGAAAAQNVPPAPGVQPAAAQVATQGYGGLGNVGYQQQGVGGFQVPPGFQGPAGYQGPPGFQSAAQVGAQQGAASSYQGGTMGQARPPVGQMGGYGTL